MNRLGSTAACAAATLGASAAGSASAAVVTTHLQDNIAATPYTIDFGAYGSVTFSTVDPTSFADNPDGVETTGSVEVLSLGEPFYASPTPESFFPDRGSGAADFPSGELGSFVAYSTPTAIPDSISDTLVGLEISEPDGAHYALVDVDGSEVTGYAYGTTPGQNLSLLSISPAPEPGMWMLTIVGLAGVGMALRRKRRAASLTLVAV